jgi:hypothetical protein
LTETLAVILKMILNRSSSNLRQESDGQKGDLAVNRLYRAGCYERQNFQGKTWFASLSPPWRDRNPEMLQYGGLKGEIMGMTRAVIWEKNRQVCIFQQSFRCDII